MNIEKLAFETLNQLQTGILICDDSEQIVFLNQKMKEMAGLTSDDNSSILEVVLNKISLNPTLTSQIHTSIQNVFYKLKEAEPIHCDMPSGSMCTIHVSPLLKNIVSSNDYCLLMFHVTPTQDDLIHEMRISKEKAEEVARLKTYFLTNFSYELRTSLNSILGYSQLLHDEMLDALTPEQQYYFSSLQWGSTHLYDTVTKIHDISRIDSGEFTISLTTLSLSKALHETVFLMRQLAAAKNIEIHLQSIPDDVNIIADAMCLSSALTNLIDNAIKYTDKGTIAIDIRILPQSKMVQCRIADTGIGIDPEVLPYLFEPFQRSTSHAHTTYETSGLGLALVKRYIELMNGTIEVESIKGKGTVFIMNLVLACKPPVDVSPIPVQVQPVLEEISRTVADISALPKILLVEDQEDAQMLVKTFLRNKYEVLIAAEAGHALEILENEKPECILMDVALQTPTGGLDLTLELRLNPDYYFIPIIALTAFAMPGDRERFIGSGMNDYLAKPYKKSDLLALLEKWVVGS